MGYSVTTEWNEDIRYKWRPSLERKEKNKTKKKKNGIFTIERTENETDDENLKKIKLLSLL